MSDINLNDIDSAISDCARLAEFYYNNTRGSRAYEQYRSYKHSAEAGAKAMAQLYREWSNFRSYMASKADAYDRYVTRERGPSSEGCSCHINPPCGYCTRQNDEADEA